MIWAVNFIAAKIGLRSFPPLTMASFRVCAAGVVMVPFYLGLKQLRLPAFAEATAARKPGFTRRDLWTFLYLGFFGVSVNQFCFTLGLHYTSVNHSAVIVGMGPIYTFILAVPLRLERATWHKAVGMAIAFTGIAVLASEGGISADSASLLGDAITMAGSIGFATYAVLGKRVACEYDALTMTAYNHFAGALVSSFRWLSIRLGCWVEKGIGARFFGRCGPPFYTWVCLGRLSRMSSITGCFATLRPRS